MKKGQQITIPLYVHRDSPIFKDMALSPFSSAMEVVSRGDTAIAKICDCRVEYGAFSNQLVHKEAGLES